MSFSAPSHAVSKNRHKNWRFQTPSKNLSKAQRLTPLEQKVKIYTDYKKITIKINNLTLIRIKIYRSKEALDVGKRLSIFLKSPCRTFPGPDSITSDAPSEIIFSIVWVHLTGAVN